MRVRRSIAAGLLTAAAFTSTIAGFAITGSLDKAFAASPPVSGPVSPPVSGPQNPGQNGQNGNQSGKGQNETVVDGCTIVADPTPKKFTNCPGADLTFANLSGVDLNYANLAGASFAACFESSGIFPPSVNCDSADLSGAQLVDANLSNSTLFDVQFLGLFPFPVLSGAGANLEGANLSGADLTGDVFGGCTFEDFCVSVHLNDANLTGTLFIPPNQTVEATSTSGAVVTYSLPQFFSGLGEFASCNPPSGSTFPIGTTTVTCRVPDAEGAAGSGTFTVTVDAV